MIASCPICLSGTHTKVHRRRAQVLIHARAGYWVDGSSFSPLTIVRCRTCGHLYNRDFDAHLLDRMYGDTPLTNVPVHPSMIDRLVGLAEWAGAENYAGKRVLEIGGGSGHFACALARKAREVTVYEPCLGATSATLGMPNLTVVNASFSAGCLSAPVDFIACRQVVEHVVSPLEFLTAMRNVLVPGGAAYIEVPAAEYIEDHPSALDFCLQHVHYFTFGNLLSVAQRAGFVLERHQRLQQGHDAGFLFRAADPGTPTEWRGPASEDRLPQRVAAWIARVRERVAALDGRVALYGANSAAQAALALLGDVRPIHAVLDDNPAYDGYVMYGESGVVPVVAPEPRWAEDCRTIIIAAYLHDAAIAGRLRALGFTGAIMTLRPDPPSGGHEEIERFA